MQSVLMAAAQAVSLDTPYDSVFVPLVDDLVDALADDDPAAFLRAVEGRSRLLATERSLRMADVFVALQLGLGAFRGALSGVRPTRRWPCGGSRPSRARCCSAPGSASRRGSRRPSSHLSRTVTTLAPTDPADRAHQRRRARPPPRRRARALPPHRRWPGGVLVGRRGRRRGSQRRAPTTSRLSPLGRLLAAWLRRYDVLGRLGDARVPGRPARREPARRAGRRRAAAPGLAAECSSRQRSPSASWPRTSTWSTWTPTTCSPGSATAPAADRRRDGVVWL